MSSKSTVFVVDDDDAVRKSLRRVMEAAGFSVETFSSAEAFLDSHDPTKPGCLLLDIKMPGMSGLELQEKLASNGFRIPVIIVSAHHDVETTVRAMKTGAVDFLRKPYEGRVLRERVRHALDLDVEIRREDAKRARVAARIAVLTPRERQVMDLLVDGKAPKQIARELNVSRKTVDVHRGHIMLKVRADSLVDLVRMSNLLREREPTASPKHAYPA